MSATSEPMVVASAASSFGAPVQNEPPDAAASAIGSTGSAAGAGNEWAVSIVTTRRAAT